MRLIFLMVVGLVVFVLGMQCASSPPCEAWGCFGGPCNTSAACVEGCHCIQGTCG